jgi:hypothetical protein
MLQKLYGEFDEFLSQWANNIGIDQEWLHRELAAGGMGRYAFGTKDGAQDIERGVVTVPRTVFPSEDNPEIKDFLAEDKWSSLFKST